MPGQQRPGLDLRRVQPSLLLDTQPFDHLLSGQHVPGHGIGGNGLLACKGIARSVHQP